MSDPDQGTAIMMDAMPSGNISGGSAPRAAWARPAEVGAWLLLFAVAVAAGLAILRPWPAASIGPDAAAPVIAFERLLAGRQLEGSLTQTSKPLLTLVYGFLRVAGGDWQAVVVATVAAFGASVVLAAELARRLGGPAAAAFVAAGFLLSPVLLADLALAYALPWALVTWLVAGLALVRDRPRFGLAGVALLLGALARPEGLALTGVAVVALAGAWLRSRAVGGPPPPRRSLLLLLGLGALPILSLHDLLLTGDAWFWLNTAQANSAGAANVRDLGGMIRFVLGHVRRLGLPLDILAAAGLVGLALARRWVGWLVAAAGVAGIAVFFVVVGARGTVVIARYLGPIDLAMVLVAGIGLGLLFEGVRRRLGDRPAGRSWTAAAVVVSALVAVPVAPAWIVDPEALERVDRERQLHANARAAFAVIRAELPAPSWRDTVVPTDAAPVVHVPIRLRAQAVVDLDLPLWAVARSHAAAHDPARGRPAPGTILYHDRIDDDPDPRWTSFEVTAPATVGKLRLVPLLADPDAGVWVHRVEAAP